MRKSSLDASEENLNLIYRNLKSLKNYKGKTIIGYDARNFLSCGKNMSLAPFVPTPPTVVKAMLQLAELKSGENLYDLGCGDGRIVIMAAQEFRAKAVGVELDEERYRECVKKINDLHLAGQVKIVHGDLLDVDLGEADVVTLYLLTSANEKVKPNLELHLKGGARVVSHDFEMPGWKPAKIKEIKEDYGLSHTLYLYKK